MASSFDYLFKFILIGDSSVGKSCLLNRFIEGRFRSEHDPTLGVEFGCKSVTLDGTLLKIQVWDTAGQQSFKSITRSYYKGSIAAFLVFDLSRRSSFENISKWLFEVKNYSHQLINIVLVGNKSDLQQDRQISQQQAKKFAKDNNFEYYETSAMTGHNVSEPFIQCARRILLKIKNKDIDPESEQAVGIKIGRKKKQSLKDRQVLTLSSSQNDNKKKCSC